MNKITTKAIALFTALLILITALPMSAMAATTDSVYVGADHASGHTADLYWYLDYNTHNLKISGSGRMYDFPSNGNRAPWIFYMSSMFGTPSNYSVTIDPGVTYIGNEAFNIPNIVSVTIPDTVTGIGSRAFEGTQITKVTLPNNLKSIGDRAFYGCTSLIKVTMPPTMTYIGNNAFYNCIELKSITVPEGITSLNDQVFKNCGDLDVAILPSTLKSIGANTFDLCYSLKTIDLPSGLRTIGQRAFYQSGLQSVTIPDSVTSIGTETFLDCDSLSEAHIGNGLGTLSTSAFKNCTSLSDVTLGENLTTINNSVFENCTSLATPPDMSNVTYLGKNALKNTAWLNAQENGVVYAGDILVTCKGDSPALYRVQSDKRVIAAGAFSGSQTLEQIGISEGVIYINDDAFNNCPNLIAASFGHQHVFGSGAFLNCPQLVFYGPKKSTAYTYAIDHNIPYGITVDETGDCEWVVHAGNLIISGEGAMEDYASSAHSPFVAGITSVVIEEGVTSIGNYAFADLPNLTSVTLPSTLTRIGGHAFENAAALTAITIPAGVTEIGEDAFAGCENLTIYGYKGTSAQTYANSHNIPFVALILGGDANGDNKTNVRDVTSIQRHVAEFQTLTGDQFLAADVDGNGVVDINDATLLQMFLAEYDVVLV